ncbi:MAG: hypothetical protein JWM58_4164 [Rhizobium sp.]|nr:hypothetical protein [Rhizobium sp.]
MRKTITAAVIACFAAVSFTAPAMADSLTIKVKPNTPVVNRVVIKPPVVKKVIVVRKACYNKTVKTVTNRKTVIVKKRICP